MAKKKGLSYGDLTALAAGQVIGAGVVTLVGQAIGLTGRSVWLAYATAIFMGLGIIFPYIMLSSMIRVKGGNYSFVAAVLGDRWGCMYGLAFTLNMLAGGMFGLSMGTYLNSIIPSVPIVPTAIIVLTLFFLANVVGVNFIAKLQKIMSIFLFAGLGLFIVVGLFRLQPGTFNFSAPNFFTAGGKGFWDAVILLVFSTVGQSFVVSFSKDAENPKRDVPFAIISATLIILVLYTAIAIVASGILPIDQVAGRPLTDVAKEIMSRPLAYAFVVGGPIMALATTINSSFGAFSRPFQQMIEDGWFSDKLKDNPDKAPVKVLGLMYLVSILPIILGLDIRAITGNVVLIARLADIVAIIAVIRAPNVLPGAWENRYFKISKPVYYVLMSISMLITLGCIFLSLRTISTEQIIITAVLSAVFFIYATLRQKGSQVHIEKSYDLQ